MRVAVLARAVSPLHGAGGLERSVRDLVRHLAARDVLVTLITPPAGHVRPQTTDPFASRNITWQAVPYVTFPFANRRGTTILDRSTAYPVYGWRAGRAARTLVRRGQVDLVHGFGASVLGYALARRRERAPLVFNPQGLEEFGATAERQSPGKRAGYWPLRVAVRACSRAADAVIATDTALEPMVVRHLGPLDRRVRVIPNGIDLIEVGGLAGPADGKLIRDRHGIGAGEAVLVTAGRIEHNKGLDVLAEALARLQQPDSPLIRQGWRWIVVGSGPFRHELDRLVEARGLSRHVHFAGRVPDADLHAWYEAATLFVHPTRYEGSSLVTLEAMAHRKAVVATRAGGLPDKVRPEVNGWLVAPDDPVPLAAALAEVLADPIRLLAMGTRSRQIVEAEFSWAVLIERYLELYRELIDKA